MKDKQSISLNPLVVRTIFEINDLYLLIISNVFFNNSTLNVGSFPVISIVNSLLTLLNILDNEISKFF